MAAPRWNDIAASDRFRSLSFEERTKLRDSYFKDFIAPTLQPEAIEPARAEWAQLTRQDMAAESTALRTLGDYVLDLGKGVVGLGEAGVGLVNLFTHGLMGKAAERAGYDPERARQFLEGYYSDERKLAESGVAESSGLLGRAEALLTNPDVLVGRAVESLPLMGTAAGVARKVATDAFRVAAANTLARTGSAQAAAQAGSQAVSAMAGRIAAVASGTEGALTAGQIAEEIRRERPDDPLAKYWAIPAGIATSIIGVLAGRLGGNVEAALATSRLGGEATGLGGGIVSRAMRGAGGEALEEAAQSGQEQVFTNLGLDRPALEGVGEAVAEGGLVGGLTGAGFGAAARRRPEEPRQETEDEFPFGGYLPAPVFEMGAGVPDDPEQLRAEMAARESADQLYREREAERQRVARLMSAPDIGSAISAAEEIAFSQTDAELARIEGAFQAEQERSRAAELRESIPAIPFEPTPLPGPTPTTQQPVVSDEGIPFERPSPFRPEVERAFRAREREEGARKRADLERLAESAYEARIAEQDARVQAEEARARAEGSGLVEETPASPLAEALTRAGVAPEQFPSRPVTPEQRALSTIGRHLTEQGARDLSDQKLQLAAKAGTKDIAAVAKRELTLRQKLREAKQMDPRDERLAARLFSGKPLSEGARVRAIRLGLGFPQPDGSWRLTQRAFQLRKKLRDQQVLGVGEGSAPREARAAELPDDMQQLLVDWYDRLPENFPPLPVRNVPVLQLESEPAGTDYRNPADYVDAVTSGEVPPLISWGDILLDGRHRVAAAKRAGVSNLSVIDLKAAGLPRPDQSPIGRIRQSVSDERERASPSILRQAGTADYVDTAVELGDEQEPSVMRRSILPAEFGRRNDVYRLNPEQLAVLAKAVRDAMKASPVARRALPRIKAFGVHAPKFIAADAGGGRTPSGNYAQYFPVLRMITVREDILNAARNDRTYRQRLVGYLVHEAHHEEDADRTNGADYPTHLSASFPAFEIEGEGDRRMPRGELMLEALDAYDDRLTPPELHDFLGYPFRMWFDNLLDNDFFKAELFAQLGRLYATNRQLMQRELPKAYALFQQIEQRGWPAIAQEAQQRAAGVRGVQQEVRQERAAVGGDGSLGRGIGGARAPGDLAEQAVAGRGERRGDVTDTPEFRRWFGASKVVDEQGRPLRVYHASGSDISRFDAERATTHRGALFFGDDPAIVSAYAGGATPYAEGQSVYPVYLSIQNPLEADFGGDPYSTRRVNALIERAKADGRDGVIIRNVRDTGSDLLRRTGENQYIVFSGDQVRFAIDNRGTFDPSDTNILGVAEGRLPERDIDRARQLGIPVTRGRIVGAPPGVAPTVSAFLELADTLARRAGSKTAHPRDWHWYADAARVIREYAGPSRERREMLVRLVAKTSQRAAVEANARAAVEAAIASARGDAGIQNFLMRPERWAEQIETILNAESFDQSLDGVGPKVLNFYRNLHDEVFGENRWPNAVTIDRHMANLIGLSPEGFSGRQYDYAAAVIVEATRRHNRRTGEKRKPREMQTRLWGWQINREGLATARREGRDFVPQPAESFEATLRSMGHRVTAEAVPSTALPEGLAITALSPRQKREFTRRAFELIEGLEERLGIGFAARREGSGAYAGQVSPNFIVDVLGSQFRREAPLDHSTATQMARALQYVLRQDAVPWFTARPELVTRQGDRVVGAEGAMIGYSLDFEGELTDADEQTILNALQETLGAEAGFTRDGQSIYVTNFSGSDAQAFVDAVERASDNLQSDLPHSRVLYGAEGHYEATDWRADPEQEGVLRALLDSVGPERAPDLEEWLRNRREDVAALAQRTAGRRARPREEVAAPLASRRGNLREEVMRLIAEAQDNHVLFSSFVRAIAEGVGGGVHIGPVKRIERALEKVENDYNGDVSKLKDLLRATIIVDGPQEVTAAWMTVREEHTFIKNRNLYTSPVGSYRDALLVISTQFGPAEIQFNTPEMMEAKARAHEHYVAQSLIVRRAAAEDRNLSPDEQEAYERLGALQEQIYEEAMRKNRERRERGEHYASAEALQSAFEAAYRRGRAARQFETRRASTILSKVSLEMRSSDAGLGARESLRPSGTSQAMQPRSSIETGTPSKSQNVGFIEESVPRRMSRAELKAWDAQQSVPTSLPEDHSRYFDTEDATTVPVDRLVASKGAEETRESAVTAAKRMRGAYDGVLERRAPLTVRARGDGTYQVVDGNSTLAAARRYGWRSLPVRVEPDQRDGRGKLRRALVAALGARGVGNLERAGIIRIVGSFHELPPGAKRGMVGTEEAVYWNGTAYLISENLPEERVVPVMLHEIGTHYGLERMLGRAAYLSILDRVRELRASGDALVDQAWGEVLRAYPSLAEGSRRFTEEVLAKVGESAAFRRLPLWQRVIHLLRRFLRSIGITRPFDSDELASLVAGSLRHAMRQSAPQPADTAVARAAASRHAAYTRVFSDLMARARQGGAEANKASGFAVPVMETPRALSDATHKGTRVLTPSHVIAYFGRLRDSGNEHGAVPDSILERLPELLERPRSLFLQKNGVVRVVLDERVGNNAVVVAIDPRRTYGKARVNEIVSVELRPQAHVQSWQRQGMQMKSAGHSAGTIPAGPAPTAEAVTRRTVPQPQSSVNQPMASRRVMPQWVAAQPRAVQEALAKAGVVVEEKTLRERVEDLKADFWKSLRQGIFDPFDPIKTLDYRAYMMARMSKSSDQGLEALMMYGRPRLRDGALDVNYEQGGFIKVMQRLQGEHDRFFSWVAGNRAARLKSEGRENLFTDEDITALKDLNQGRMPGGASRAELYASVLQQLNSYSKAVLDIAQETGLINAEDRATWEHDFYVPFYRVMEEGAMGPNVSKGLVNQYAFKRLKGGRENLNDLLANTLRNWSHLLSASLKNQAARATLEAAVAAGVAIEVPSQQVGKEMRIGTDVLKVLDEGVERFFMVEDEFLLDAITSMEWNGFQGPVMKALQKFKHWLTFGHTVNPTFRIRNLMRDAISAMATASLSYNPFKNIAQGWKATGHDTESRASMLASGAIFRFGTMLEGQRADYVRRLIDKGVDRATIIDSESKLKAVLQKWWDAYQENGDRFENANRAALYQQLREQGYDHLEASFAARDLLDFTMQGKWRAVRFLVQTVPFFNARLQGLYKLGRSAKEDPRRMGYVMGAVIMASLALLLYYRDDEDWKKREEWDRDNFWWFKVGDTAFRIPKPFEVGAIGSAAERFLEWMISTEKRSGERLLRRMGAIVADNLSMNPIPQMIKPLIDLYANKDSFTGRPIETMGMERLSKPERVGPRTTVPAQLLGKLGLFSPVQIDFAVRAYFGWVGTAALTAIDYGLRPLLGFSQRPAMQLRDVFLVGNFVESLPSSQSRYVTAFYEQAKRVEEAYADYRNAVRMGDAKKAQRIARDKAEDIATRNAVSNVKQRLTRINQEAKRVEASTTISPETKRRLLDMFAAQRDRLAQQAMR